MRLRRQLRQLDDGRPVVSGPEPADLTAEQRAELDDIFNNFLSSPEMTEALRIRAAEVDARDWLNQSQALEINGPIADMLRCVLATALTLMFAAGELIRCAHLLQPQPVFARAARPTRLMCVSCSNHDAMANDSDDPREVPCDGCGRMGDRVISVIALHHMVFILAVLCPTCLVSEAHHAQDAGN